LPEFRVIADFKDTYVSVEEARRQQQAYKMLMFGDRYGWYKPDKKSIREEYADAPNRANVLAGFEQIGLRTSTVEWDFPPKPYNWEISCPTVL
jgi:hypothetical protein